uniref:Uncharacterized protein n=1 Tax=Oryza punctata TaxID=4537 RepID=A0A0E0M719_ORYPU
MEHLLVLVGPNSVVVLADNEFSAINMGVDESGGSNLFAFGPAWPDGIIDLVDELAPAVVA